MYNNMMHASTSLVLVLLDISNLRVTVSQKTNMYRTIMLAIGEEFESRLNTLNTRPSDTPKLSFRILDGLDEAVQFALNGSVFSNMEEAAARLQTRLPLFKVFLTEATSLLLHVPTKSIIDNMASKDLLNIAKRLG